MVLMVYKKRYLLETNMNILGLYYVYVHDYEEHIIVYIYIDRSTHTTYLFIYLYTQYHI